jgi:hypothetical protein
MQMPNFWLRIALAVLGATCHSFSSRTRTVFSAGRAATRAFFITCISNATDPQAVISFYTDKLEPEKRKFAGRRGCCLGTQVVVTLH